MRAILVHIGWVQNPKTGFCEMTEVAAMELHEIDGLVVSGGRFHSFIRPVFQHWKLKRAYHGQYSNWWLAPTFTKVMNDFSRWMEPIKDVPWLVWSRKSFSVWQSNASRHEYNLIFPKEVVYLSEELESIDYSYTIGETSYTGEKEEPYSMKVVRDLSKLLNNDLRMVSLHVQPLQLPTIHGKLLGKRETIVKQLMHLVNEKRITIDEVSEWSGLSVSQLLRIFNNEKQLNKFERERLMEAWTMWEIAIDLRKNWLD